MLRESSANQISLIDPSDFIGSAGGLYSVIPFS